jgi:hypothetical protein
VPDTLYGRTDVEIRIVAAGVEALARRPLAEI